MAGARAASAEGGPLGRSARRASGMARTWPPAAHHLAAATRRHRNITSPPPDHLTTFLIWQVGRALRVPRPRAAPARVLTRAPPLRRRRRLAPLRHARPERPARHPPPPAHRPQRRRHPRQCDRCGRWGWRRYSHRRRTAAARRSAPWAGGALHRGARAAKGGAAVRVRNWAAAASQPTPAAS